MDDKTPVFEVGQIVVATGSYQWRLTEGKQYKVVDYKEELPLPGFTWPAYITVIGDSGRRVTGHTHRFRALKDGEEVQLTEDQP